MSLEVQANLVNQVLLELLARLGQVVKQDLLVIVVCQVILAYLASQVFLVSQENLEREDFQDLQEHQEQRDHQDFKVSQEREDCLDHLVKMVEKERLGQVDQMALEVTKENKELQDHQVVKDQ